MKSMVTQNIPQKEMFEEKSFNKVIKKCKTLDFPPEELEKLRSICVDKVHICLQHPVEVNDTTHLISGTTGSCINRRDQEWNGCTILIEKVII